VPTLNFGKLPIAFINLLEGADGVSQSVDLGQSNNPNTTPTKNYEIVQVVVYLCGVQRGSTPTG